MTWYNTTMVNSGHHKSGFTIVELIIVVVVIAVLAAVSYVAYGKITDDARASATASELKSLKTSMDIYIARKSPIQKQYPNTIAEVRATNLPKDFLDKTQWEMYSYYGAYQKRGGRSSQGSV